MKLYTYQVRKHQREILKDIKKLPRNQLHYLVVQQSLKYTPLTLNELKKHIRQGVKNHVKEWMGHQYRPGCENEIIEYFGLFETSKDFWWSQHSYNLNQSEFDLRFHFHLFLSSQKPQICLDSVIYSIFKELTSQRNKVRSISKFDYNRVTKLDDDFILYHTKQLMYGPSNELVIKNND